MTVSLQERFRGCLLGVAVGDALGGRLEGRSREHIRTRFPSIQALMDYPQDELWYTDDTQMTIGIAECLIEQGQILEGPLCKAFVSNYVPSRGYGPGARVVLDAMEEGQDHRKVAAEYYPGGSYGNGAAMRVAPVGLLFHQQPEQIAAEARLSALPTHVHPLGIEGAILMAVAVAHVCRSPRLDRASFYADLLAACTSTEFHTKIAQAAAMTAAEFPGELGNGIQSLESVPTAIASFALAPDSYEQAVGAVIRLGGDTDTLAAMTGALSGAYLGTQGLPARLVALLEDHPKGKGRTHLLHLADGLHARINR